MAIRKRNLYWAVMAISKTIYWNFQAALIVPSPYVRLTPQLKLGRSGGFLPMSRINLMCRSSVSLRMELDHSLPMTVSMEIQ